MIFSSSKKFIFFAVPKTGTHAVREVLRPLLTDADWERMKQHMDEKFPNMKLPDMQSFKDLCRIYNMTDRFNEKKLN